MSRSDKYGKNKPDLMDQSSALFERWEIPFKRSSEEVWKDLSERIHSGRQLESKPRQHVLNKRWIAVAATLTLLLTVGTFLRLYRVKSQSPPGENFTIELPDGSQMIINARTTASFHPLWWPISREVQLEGEAFFNVKKGKRFAVVTPLGTSEVLGTTFTVYAREERFKVTCQSGSVRVTEASSAQSVTISQNEMAELSTTGELDIRTVMVDPFLPAWQSTLMMFTSAPLREVFDEIETQFGIRIETADSMNYIYTGNFAPDQSVEKILSLICRPFDLVYEKRSGSEYYIFPSAAD